MLEVLVPFAMIVAGVAVMVEVDVEAGPTTNMTAVEFVMADPFNVPVIVAVPKEVEDVRVAV